MSVNAGVRRADELADQLEDLRQRCESATEIQESLEVELEEAKAAHALRESELTDQLQVLTEPCICISLVVWGA
jgi:hypothetical protein